MGKLAKSTNKEKFCKKRGHFYKIIAALMPFIRDLKADFYKFKIFLQFK